MENVMARKEVKRSIKYVCKAIKWFDKVNGNTYHSVQVTRCFDNKTLYGQFQYGYGDSYRQTALDLMGKAGWLINSKGYDYSKHNDSYMFEREQGYPIEWIVSDGLKRDCIANGQG